MSVPLQTFTIFIIPVIKIGLDSVQELHGISAVGSLGWHSFSVQALLGLIKYGIIDPISKIISKIPIINIFLFI
ncbi:MAG: hypothetical protein ABIG69_17555 [Bacteroidota bacterium]